MLNNFVDGDITQINIVNKNENKTNKYPIRILHCVAGLGRGGYETLIMNVYRNIDRSKVQFDFLYSFDGVFNEEILKLGGRLYKIPFITQKGPIAYKNSVDNFLKNHKEYKIVHSHMDKFSGLIMKIAKQNKIPTRIAHSHSTKNEGGLAYNIIKNYYGKMINKNCTDRFACSEKAYNWLFNKNGQNKKIISNGIDLNKFQVLDNRDKNFFTIVNVGRFVKVKNHSFLIDVFKEIKMKDKTSKLLLAGTGELQKEIKEKVEQLGLSDSVEFLNDCDDIPSLLSKADVLCMPSLFEGFGIALIEAQAVGVNCVASDRIPKEADVSNTVKFISLDNSAEFWAKEIIKLKGIDRINSHTMISQKGYDISTTAKFLQDFYIKNGV